MAVAGRTVLDVLRLSTVYLGEHGSGTPRLDAELLCAHALGLQRMDVYLQFDRPLRDGELDVIRELVRRRGRGEPVAYLSGVREFYGRSFAVDPAVLIPRPETETLVEVVLRHLRAGPDGGRGARVADLGTGSGCIAVSLAAEMPGLRVVATDVSAAALVVAQRNAERHGVSERISFVQGSWGEALEGALDMVVSNPPYVTTDELAHADRDVRDFEPHVALLAGDDGLDAYRALLESLRGTLRDGARIILEVDPRRTETVRSLITAEFAGADTIVARDLAGRDRVVDAQLPA